MPEADAHAEGLRICIVYDCLFPWTIGGAERWYRGLAERLVGQGHAVTYLTLRQWARTDPPRIAGVEVRAVGPRMRLYTKRGRRRMLPPVVMGLGVLLHLLRNRHRYDVIHLASFPYFPLLAAALFRTPLVVDWHEFWTADYWTSYLGGPAGRLATWIQALCVRVPQASLAFSEHTARRLRAAGLQPSIIEGMLAEVPEVQRVGRQNGPPVVISAGRWIREKRVPLVVAATSIAAERIAGLTLHIFGDGPDRTDVQVAVANVGDRARIRGRVSGEALSEALATASVLVVASEREGYGLVAVEAWAMGTPVVTTPGEHNALAERVVPGENGVLARSDSPEDLAEAIVAAINEGEALRERVSAWFVEHAAGLSIDSSMPVVDAAYSTAMR